MTRRRFSARGPVVTDHELQRAAHFVSSIAAREGAERCEASADFADILVWRSLVDAE